MAAYPKESATPSQSGSDPTIHVYDEKAVDAEVYRQREQDATRYDVKEGNHTLHRSLRSRHMQMIAVGGAIGAGLFVGSGGSFHTGGPAAVVICFIIIGIFLLLTMQALAELAVMYPVNGAFYKYCLRFISRPWGFATGWDYAISWLTVLPFEITAAGLTIDFWTNGSINIGVWTTVFLVILSAIQIFGVRGYGEVEFILSIIKIAACTGFIIFGIVVNTGGVPTDNRGYIGGRYWQDGQAFRGGFPGFCSVFVNAAFAFAGTELVGLAAAEAENPLKAIPTASKQVFWRILFFYVVNLLIVGLIIPSDSQVLLGSSGANTKASPFVLAIEMANVKVLPSIFNAVIMISVISVANSCTFGSTRTIQALASEGMAPKIFEKIDKHGRPIWCVVLQVAFGFLAFINEANEGGSQFFDWLLALSGMAYFFTWGSICLSHARFRAGWKAQGRTLDEIPYKAPFGVAGSWVGFGLACLCIVATFYSAVFPPGPDGAGAARAESFFQQYLTVFIILLLYLGWMFYTKDFTLFIRAKDMDITTGVRLNLAELQEAALERQAQKTWKNLPLRIVRGLI